MKNKNKIINELYEKSPDVRERIKKDVDFSQFEKKNAPAAKSSNGFKWATAVLSVALIAMIAVLAPIIAKTSKPGKSGKTPGVSYASDYVVFIDVNPSVRLDVSGGDVVTAQKGMNKDGVVLLYQENLVGKNIDEAATYLIEKMDEAGLVKDKGKVRISVADKKTGKRIDEKQRHALEVVNNLFQNKNKDVSAMILSDNEIDAIEDYYDNNNVGEYEKQMIKEFRRKLIDAINEKIRRIDELLNNILKPWEKDERKVKKLDQNDAEKAALEAIKVYCADYKVNYYEVANDEIAEFCEELFDKKKDLQECIDDIKTSDGDDSYGEILSDLLEIVKEELFEQED
ncbi:MAG: hypothetical protein MR741_06035 [Clostridiales bacterium]|nr:hypothetical protein [Clostridiales bacterium]MDD7054434.1 hypothetical protein [Clostridiales bacterium]MDY5190194.1 hypothetical protein [Eubacteriales bacterium]